MWHLVLSPGRSCNPLCLRDTRPGGICLPSPKRRLAWRLAWRQVSWKGVKPNKQQYNPSWLRGLPLPATPSLPADTSNCRPKRSSRAPGFLGGAPVPVAGAFRAHGRQAGRRPFPPARCRCMALRAMQGPPIRQASFVKRSAAGLRG